MDNRKMNNQEKLETLGTQDKGRRQIKLKAHYAQTDTNNINKT